MPAPKHETRARLFSRTGPKTGFRIRLCLSVSIIEPGLQAGLNPHFPAATAWIPETARPLSPSKEVRP